jgi:L-seryl-tRNA(Ser) seleniumtransferase
MRSGLLRPVINATGVLLHTNLGRAPLAVHREARAINLEMDIHTGRRSQHRSDVPRLLSILTGAEDAMVVNNGAAAVLLVLAALAKGRAVLVSRGELVEIGGGFRIPEVLAVSGADLVEVGTTNRTRLQDYRSALEELSEAALILKVHQSNYRIVGFSQSVGVEELASLGVPLVYDIGSGLIDANTPWLERPPAWLAGEPAARQALEKGASLVTFSADKLFGGPQAGIIAGRSTLVSACAKHPLARALRPGGLVLSALEEVALAYLRRDADAIPFWKMAVTPCEELRARAGAISTITGSAVVECPSVAGGGSVPGLEISSIGVAVHGDITGQLRLTDPPVMARVVGGRTVCDLRSVDPADDDLLSAALLAAGRS